VPRDHARTAFDDDTPPDPGAAWATGTKRNGRDPGALGEWDAGEDDEPIPPRGWLLGNVLCRRFLSSLVADGGVGKTAVRIAQCLALATGRPLTGEHVFQRCRVLLVSLEDDRDELRRRVEAARLHYGISRSELRGWLFLATPGIKAGKLAMTENGAHKAGALAAELAAVIVRRSIDVICLDPFVKSHGVEENANNAIDFVAGLLAQIAIDYDCAVDVPHHMSKGPADPGNANRGRGAGAFKDAARLVYTLAPMSEDEAKQFGIGADERRRLIRMDGGKVNIAAPAADAKWFRLIGVPIGNSTDLYPTGDDVQTIEVWEPPDFWAEISTAIANEILDKIEAGLPDGRRYSGAPQAGKERGAWSAVQSVAVRLSDQQAKKVIATWLENGVIEMANYTDPVKRRASSGLVVNATKRPG
jgi:hypothetical protein